MIDGSENCNGWLNIELHSAYVIERCSNSYVLCKKLKYPGSHFVQKAPKISEAVLLCHHKPISRIHRGQTIFQNSGNSCRNSPLITSSL